MSSQSSKAPRRESVLRPPLTRSRSAVPKSKVLAKPKESPELIDRRPVLRKEKLIEKLKTPRRAGKFSLVDVSIEEPPRTQRKRARSPSDSTSSTKSAGKKKQRLARLRRSSCRGKKVLNHIMEHGTEMTFLEEQAIGPLASVQYQNELKAFTDFLQVRGIQINLSNAMELDGHLVDYLNQMYLDGHQSYKADRLRASFMHRHPEFGKNGDMKLPRTWRAIKGYRKLTPGKSREAFPLAIWAAYAVEMRKLGKLRMRIFLMLSLSSYARPSELLRARVFSLVRPAASINRAWSLLLSPEEHQVRSKTGEFDTSILLDSPYLIGWIESFLECLKCAHPESHLWDFDYEEYQRTFKLVSRMLGIEATPYQTRHSGPSIDRARNYRSQLEVQKRGQWRAQKSVMRYEKSARLALSWEKVPQLVKDYALSCEENLGEFLLGRKEVPKFAGNSK